MQEVIQRCENLIKKKSADVIEVSNGVYLIKVDDEYILYISDKVHDILWGTAYNESILLKYEISKLTVVGGNNLESCVNMFAYCKSLKEINFQYFNTQNVTDMQCMFMACASLQELDLTTFNTSKVKCMYCMFEGCVLLKELKISSWNTANVSDMAFMFKDCKSLHHLDTTNFNTSNITNMGMLFYGCSTLQDLDVSHFNVEKVTDMCGIFDNCNYSDTFKGIDKFKYANEAILNAV